mmetsp:Transcript_153644/g.268688  ORF Transcript_153644/g.268688 Transcript_153644/m.268688 type:complete len:353 (-) Transcript_153644:588-1646(-)
MGGGRADKGDLAAGCGGGEVGGGGRVQPRVFITAGVPVDSLCAGSASPAAVVPAVLPLLQLLDAVGVAQCVQGVLAAGRGGGDVGDHHGPAVPDEGIPQDLRQLRPAEGDVPVALVQGPDALLEGQQALVNLRPLDARLLLVVPRVRPTLAARQVDERELAKVLVRLCVADADLQDGVGPRGLLVGPGLPGGPHRVPKVDQLAQGSHVVDVMLCEADDVDALLCVFAGAQLLTPVQQVEELAPVDLEEGAHNLLRGLQPLVDVLAGLEVQAGLHPWLAHHGVCLPTAGLSKCKAGCVATLEHSADERFRSPFIDVFVVVMLIKHLIKYEFGPLNILRQIHLLLWGMNCQLLR